MKEARKELSEEESKELDSFIEATVESYVQAEHNFFDLIFSKGDQQGLTKEDAKLFISYLGRLRLAQVGILKGSEVGENPLEWIDYIISGNTHTNFFENKVADYSHDGLKGEVDYTKYLSKLEERYM